MSKVEIPFDWTCPSCGHRQTDTVNPDLGPYLSVTCGACCSTHDERTMTETDYDAWQDACNKAEAYLETD